MRRRTFFGTTGIAGILTAGLTGCRKETTEEISREPENFKLAEYTIKQLRRHYHSYLFDDFIPYFDRYVIDHEYGGFMYNTDRDGTHITTNKGAWYEGRGIWVYSYIYNELAREQKYLDVAGKSVEFILKNLPEGDTLFAASFSRDGTPISEPAKTLYGDLYIAAGLAEYASASGDRTYWNIAKDILLKCLRIYDCPDYDSIVSGDDPVQGPRRQNVSMLILPATTSLLKFKDDTDIETVAQEHVDAVISRFYNSDYRLNNTILNHDYSRTDNNHAQNVSFGVSIQTLWMVLYESVRLEDKTLFDTTTERIRRHITVAWDDVYGGIFSGLTHVDKNTGNLSKPLYNQAESLIGLLTVIEHTGDRWAQELFSKIYAFTIQKYVQKEQGYLLWQDSGDRKVTLREHATRAENFHHPRHLVLNLHTLNRMIERGGKISQRFS